MVGASHIKMGGAAHAVGGHVITNVGVARRLRRSLRHKP